MSKLLEKAKALSIQNAESLTEPQLKKAIETAEKKAKEEADLVAKAIALGIETEDKSLESLAIEIELAEVEIQAQADLDLFNDKAQLLVEFLSIPNFDNLSLEELSAVLEEKRLQSAPEIETVDLGKADGPFDISGQLYEFEESAPSAFRYLGKLQSQKEWIEDSYALELMVSTKLPYVKPFKK